MQLETLRYLAAMAQYGSTRKAAEALNTSYQNVSRVLHLAEEELGRVLFERTSKGMTPTADGAAAIDCAQQMLALYDALLMQFHEQPRLQPPERLAGKLHLVSSIIVSNSIVNDILLEFSAQYPKIQVSISEEDAYAPISEAAGQLYFVPRTAAEVGAQPYPTLSLLTDKMVMLVKTHSSFDRQKSISFKKLLGLPLVLIAKDDWANSVFGRILQEKGYVPKQPLYISSIIGFQKYIGTGQYVGLSTEKLSRKMMSDKKHYFQLIPIRDDGITIHHCLIIRNPAALTAVERHFVGFIKEYFHIT